MQLVTLTPMFSCFQVGGDGRETSEAQEAPDMGADFAFSTSLEPSRSVLFRPFGFPWRQDLPGESCEEFEPFPDFSWCPGPGRGFCPPALPS